MFLLTRTNTEVAKHKGLTMFVVPMDTPGIDITPCTPWVASAPTSPTTTTCGCPTSFRVGDVDAGLEGDDDRPGVRAERRLVRRGGAPARPRRALGRVRHGSRRHARLADPLVRERLARGRHRQRGVEPARLAGRLAGVHRRPARAPRAPWPSSSPPSTTSGSANDFIDLLGADGLRRHGSRRRARRRLDRGHLPPLPGHHHLRGHQRGAARHHRRARPRPAPQPLVPHCRRPRTRYECSVGWPGKRPLLGLATASTPP